MKQSRAVHAFATLGHPDRMTVFRLLMRFAPQGLRPTGIAGVPGLKQNTLSHHLADLTAAGLAIVERQGRSLFHAVDLETTEGLIGRLALDVGRVRPDLLAPLLLQPKDATRLPAPPPDSGFDVLVLCSGNSASSILAEALLRDPGKGRFRAVSVGTRPGTRLPPPALKMLCRNGHDTAGLRSKPVSEFQQPGAVVMACVATHCNTAAAKECPPWPGRPITGHRGLPDPVKVTGTDAEKAPVFARTHAAPRRRIPALVELPFASLGRLSLLFRLDAIGTNPETRI